MTMLCHPCGSPSPTTHRGYHVSVEVYVKFVEVHVTFVEVYVIPRVTTDKVV